MIRGWSGFSVPNAAGDSGSAEESKPGPSSAAAAPSADPQGAEADMECSIYQNYGASEVFVQGLAGILNQQDVEAMIRAQKKMLQRFEKTNEMLSNCNQLSATRLERATRDFKAHSVMLSDMKKDLDVVLKRIAALKHKLAQQNPEALKACGYTESVEEEDDEYDQQIKMRNHKREEQ